MLWTDQSIEINSEKRDSILKTLGTSQNILEEVQRVLPNWIVYSCDGYTSEYSILENNWKNLCNEWKTTPKKILIVSFIPSREVFEKLQSIEDTSISYLILATSCNRLAANGFVVRTTSELVPCVKCNRAMLSKRVFEYLFENKSPLIVESWKDTCKDCS